jgi:hypothetical protein
MAIIFTASKIVEKAEYVGARFLLRSGLGTWANLQREALARRNHYRRVHRDHRVSRSGRWARLVSQTSNADGSPDLQEERRSERNPVRISLRAGLSETEMRWSHRAEPKRVRWACQDTDARAVHPISGES